MENKSEQNRDIEISILKGDKLFNQNTPFVINLLAPEKKEQEEKRISADLICVIDISGSMMGDKIYQVRESLKILVDMMDQNDRIALVLFDNKGELYYDLNFLTKDNKSHLKNLIEKIDARGGTNIATGLEVAVNILIKEKNKSQNDEGRSSSVLLLSDGCDNYLDDIQLGEKLKSLTKGQGLSFTLNTFGYGYDHDPKIMNKLANLRDGSFFLVEDYNKVGEYLVSVLGGCISMISKNSQIEVDLLNQNCKIVKLFGESNLFSYELKQYHFKNKMLQFISGKEYTFVLEIQLDESNIKPGDELLDINFTYEDITTKETIKLNSKYIYQIKDLQFAKANEEYIRSQVYDVLERAVKLRENNQFEQGKKLLKEIEDWIIKNYKGDNKDYLNDIKKSKQMFENNYLGQVGFTNTISMVNQMQSKRAGTNMNYYSNSAQVMLQNNYRMNYSQSVQNNNNFNPNFNFMNNNFMNNNNNNNKFV